LDNRQWDIILFNFGLHDLVHKDQENKYDVVNGKISVHPQNSKPGNVHYTPEGYEQLASYVVNAIKSAYQ